MLYEFIMDVMVQTVLITFFVLSMILLLEYLNVFTVGHVHDFMQSRPKLQILISSALGILPGCIGSYTAVSLYTHDVIGFGALMANLIATTGDEAFYMISLMPDKCALVFGVLLVLSVVVGYVISLLRRSHKSLGQSLHFAIHRHHDGHSGSLAGRLADNFRDLSVHRIVLVAAMVIFIVLTLCGFLDEHHDHGGHEEEGFSPVTVTFLVLSVLSLMVILWVPNHFLEHHIWEHVIGKHFKKVALWTLVALTAIFVINNVVDIEAWVSQFSAGNVYFFCLVAAILTGLIPESGPHLVFITLYVNGLMPMGALMANCIVQDGHGAIPLFAESKRDFFLVKGIKVAVALLVSLVFWFMGL